MYVKTVSTARRRRRRRRRRRNLVSHFGGGT
jgi:hypothetical protein